MSKIKKVPRPLTFFNLQTTGSGVKGLIQKSYALTDLSAFLNIVHFDNTV